MKRLFCLTSVMLFTLITFVACSQKEVKVSASSLKNVTDSASYIMGYTQAMQMKVQGVEINPEVFATAIQQVLSGDTTSLLTQEQMQKTMQSYQEMMMQKQMAELKSLLEGFGYSIGDNYDITKESDYDLTIDKLKLSKNKSIAKVTNMLSSIKIDSDNKQAKTRKQSIETMIKILRKDKEGDVELSMSTMDDEDELLQALNSAIANKSVIQRYREKIRKEKEKNGEYKDLEEAYCANY